MAAGDINIKSLQHTIHSFITKDFSAPLTHALQYEPTTATFVTARHLLPENS
jgi:hypothetical protein